MAAPTTELCGGYWVGFDVVDAYARACTLLTDPVAGVYNGPVPKVLTVRADQVQSPAPDGRPIVGYPAPSVDPVWVATSLTNAATVLVNGVDFYVQDGYVWFEQDPFEIGVSKYLVWVDGEAVHAVDLWYSPATETPAATITQAATHFGLTKAIAAACASPATGPTRETVEAVWEASDGSYRVVTDRNTYTLGEADTPSVAVDAVLAPGSPLGSAWELTRLDANTDLAYITTPAYFHQGVTTGDITWYNETVNTVVSVVTGRTFVRWELGGSQADVDALWVESFTRGTASGVNSLARATVSDVSSDQTIDPTPAAVPTTVNPAQFLCRELFGGCGYQLFVRTDRCGPDALPSAARQTAAQDAAGPYTAILYFEDTIPAGTRRTPS